LSVSSASTLGTGALTITGGELLATTTETINNQMTMSGNFTIAAAHGQTLTTSGLSPWTLNAAPGEMINFGAAGQDGTVVFKFAAGTAINGINTYTVNVQAGTLKAGDGGLSFLLGNALATVVQSGATLDVAGFSPAVNGLQGGGHVGNSGGATTLNVFNGNFAGTIDGPLTLRVFGGLTLTGANTYTGGTTISSGTLTLGNGGATGSVAGNIADFGTLAINHSDMFTLNNVSGTGVVSQIGSGTTILGSGLSYSGGTSIAAGILSVGNAGALGSGALTINGGELLATTTETIGNQLTMNGNFTIAAAHGQTLTTFGASPWVLNAIPG